MQSGKADQRVADSCVWIQLPRIAAAASTCRSLKSNGGDFLIVAQGMMEGWKSSFCQTELLPTLPCFLLLVMSGILLRRAVCSLQELSSALNLCTTSWWTLLLLFCPCSGPCSVPKTFTVHLKNMVVECFYAWCYCIR